MKSVRLYIKGRVQGVFYRQSTRQMASQLGLAGWVRNLPDGSVEALAHGSIDALETLISWCHEGPPAARVSSVEAIWLDGVPEELGRLFEIR